MIGKKELIARIQLRLVQGTWDLLLLLLPITSLPLLADIVGGSTVNPAAVVPLIILFIVWFVPYFFQKGSLNLEVVPFLGFIAVAVFTSILIHFNPVLPWKGQTVFSREMSAWLTLLAGFAFYIVTSTIVTDSKKLIHAVKVINVGAVLMFVWALMQGGYIFFNNGNFPVLIQRVHEFISIRDLHPKQITGFAYEASWFCHQVNILYFPIWLGIIIYSGSLYKRRVGKFPIELVLFLIGVLALVLSRSRIGLLSLLVIVGILILMFIFRRLGKARHWFSTKIRMNSPFLIKFTSTLFSILLLFFVFLFFLSLAILVIYLVSKIDPRLERIFMISWSDFIPFSLSKVIDQLRLRFTVQFANFLMFAERSVYWVAAYRIFGQYPLFGVGLGNAGFFFPENMPAFSWSLPEVVNVLRDGTEMFPNPKNLWLRLLAETGIVGFTFFIVWILCIFYTAWNLLSCRRKKFRAIGFAGIIGVIVLLVEGFSLDTFGLPYMWVLFGLVSATSRLASSNQEALHQSSTV
jgi:hypothetical protein